MTRQEYDSWLDLYIQKNGIDVTFPVYQGVVNGVWYSITRGQIFDKSRENPNWRKAFYFRLNPREELDRERDLFLKFYAQIGLENGLHF